MGPLILRCFSIVNTTVLQNPWPTDSVDAELWLCRADYELHVQIFKSAGMGTLTSPFPQNPTTTILFPACMCLLFQISHISVIVQYLSFRNWLISFSTMSSRCIYVVTYGRISFLWQDNIPLCVYTIFSLSILLLMDIQVVSTSWL